MAHQRGRSASAYEQAVVSFRSDPGMVDFVERNFLEDDLFRASSRYAQSGEFLSIEKILRQHLRPGERILDVGIGRGLTSIALGRSGFTVIGVERDPSEVVGILAAGRVLRTCLIPVSLIQGDVHRLPFPDATFDAVLCRSVLHHLSEMDLGLREIARVMRPGGLFVVCNEHIVSLFSNGEKFLKAHPAVRYGVEERAYPTSAYVRKIRKAGFYRIRFFRYPLGFSEFLEAIQWNPVRAWLVKIPLFGSGLARILYMIHVVVRAYLLVPEQTLPAICLVCRKY